MTTAGAACVFFVRKNLSLSFKRIFLGFAAGVMTAASIWSLLLPAMEQAEAIGNIPWVPATIGFILGGLFLLLIDKIIPHIHMDSKDPEGPPSSFKRQTLLYLAVAIHNIPEGLAVGLAFGLALKNSGDVGLMAVAVGLALGIGLQTFGRGGHIAADEEEGSTKRRSFLYGMASGAVEPIFGLLGVFWRPSLLDYALGLGVCGGCHDLRGGRRTDSGSAFGRTFPYGNVRIYGRCHHYDDSRCCFRIKNKKNLKIVWQILVEQSFFS